MCDIIIDIPTILEYGPNILEKRSLESILCKTPYFHVRLIQHNTEFLLQIFYFDPVQLKPFGLHCVSETSNLALTFYCVSSISKMSSTKNIHHQTFSWIDCINSSITKANRNKLRIDPWRSPISTEKCSESPSIVLTQVFVPIYMSFITLTYNRDTLNLQTPTKSMHSPFKVNKHHM